MNAPSFERLDFDAMTHVALDAARDAPPDVIVGSSLGAVAALEVARRGVAAPLVLIAPALSFAARWIERLPPGDPLTLFHHGRGRPAAIHRAFFERMARLDVDASPPAAPVTIVMGRLDESVPFDVVHETWRRRRADGRLADGSEFASISDGDHGLVEHVPRIADAVVARAAPAR